MKNFKKIQFPRNVKRKSKSFSKDKEKLPVSFLGLFRFASKKDEIMLFIAVVSSLTTGVAFPIWMIVWAELANALVSTDAKVDSNGTILESLTLCHQTPKERFAEK